jgi:hypothetical protein
MLEPVEVPEYAMDLCHETAIGKFLEVRQFIVNQKDIIWFDIGVNDVVVVKNYSRQRLECKEINHGVGKPTFKSG